MRLRPDTTALVEFTADDSVVLTEGSRAVIRYDDLIGGRYLALEEGAGGTKKLNPGDTIPLARTSPALDLDALIGGFRPLFRALDPDQVNALSGQLITALQGQGGTINSFLSQTAALTTTLADRDQLIGQVIVNLNTVLGSLGDQSDQFAKAVDALAELVKGLESRKQDISQRRWPTPTPPRAASPTCWRRPGRRSRRRSTRPTAPQGSSSPTTTISTTSSTPCRTRIKRWRGKASTATSSASTCATSCSSSTARGPAGVRQGCGSEHREVRTEMKPFSERNLFVIGAIGLGVTVAIVLGCAQLRQAAVPQPGQGVLGLLRRGRRADGRCRRAGFGFPGGQGRVHRARRAAGAGEVHRRQEHSAR